MEMTEAPKLLPCPFCGGSAVLCKPFAGRPYVACEDNFCSGPKDGPDEAIAAWNTRSTHEAAVAAARKEGMLEAADEDLIWEALTDANDVDVSFLQFAKAVAEAIRKAAEASK